MNSVQITQLFFFWALPFLGSIECNDVALALLCGMCDVGYNMWGRCCVHICRCQEGWIHIINLFGVFTVECGCE